MSGEYPSVPEDRLAAGGWTLRSRSDGVVFRMPGMTVTGYTLLYGDEQLRKALAESNVESKSNRSTGDSDGFLGGTNDEIGRFFFATALSFQPPLPGIGPAIVRPTVMKQARQSLASDFQRRGFEQLEWDDSQRLRTGSGDRGRLWKFTARLPASADEQRHDALEIEGWQAVWTTEGSFRIAGGAYPVVDPGDVAEELSTDPRRFRDELLELIRSVR